MKENRQSGGRGQVCLECIKCKYIYMYICIWILAPTADLLLCHANGTHLCDFLFFYFWWFFNFSIGLSRADGHAKRVGHSGGGGVCRLSRSKVELNVGSTASTHVAFAMICCTQKQHTELKVGFRLSQVIWLNIEIAFYLKIFK